MIPKGMTVKEFYARYNERRKKRRAKAQKLWAHPPRQFLRKQNDTAWSFAILRRDRNKRAGLCVLCSKWPMTVACHIIPKQRGDSIRWDLDNGYGGCNNCNYGEFMNRSLYREIHIERFGRELYSRLEEQARTKIKFSVADLRDIGRGLRDYAEALR
jgi:hypothetical protein